MSKRPILIIFIVLSLLIAGQTLGWLKLSQSKADISAPLQGKTNSQPKPDEKAKEKIVFVGDMMFDRGVEDMMKNMGFTYPIDSIKDFLKGFDYAVGNLEGPISEKPKDFPDDSLKFSFDSKSVESLKEGNFKLVSLANNHTLDTGATGLEETKKILKDNEIGYAGDPIKCDIDYLYQKDDVSFYAVNETYPSNCSDNDLVGAFSEVRYYNPDSFIVVLIHWGDEYKTVASATQEKMAHELIDVGADVVLGGHPHVVQNIEEYKGKLIFYSLGNFIFDQYFSEETQEGLAVGIERYSDKTVYTLYPIKNRLSQPSLIQGEDKQAFLDDLAKKSSEDLSESIKNGIIEIIKD